MITIASPFTGWVTPLETVPDAVFADRMMGDGLAVDPTDGRLVAPGAGVVLSVHQSSHAVTLQLDSGPVLLVHVGVDTVGLGGRGFTTIVTGGQRVEQGETLLLVDLDVVAKGAKSLATPVILTNGDAFHIVSRHDGGTVSAGEPLFAVEAIGAAAAASPVSDTTASRTLRLVLAHGMHARPAARLAKLATEFAADVEVTAQDGRVAPVRSPVAMLGLGLPHGATFTLRASGAESESAVAALAALLDTGMGELLPLGEEDTPTATVPVTGSLRGIAAVHGLAIGPAWHLPPEVADVPERADDAGGERAALAEALQHVEQALLAEAELDGVGASIAAAQQAILTDPVLGEEAERLISAGKSAGFAWRQSLERAAAPLRASRDPRFLSRMDDFRDLEQRVLTALTGSRVAAAAPPEGAIVIAETLYASQLRGLAEAGVAGLATAAGGATSHAAIIAAGLGLPMLVGLGEAVSRVPEGTALILRGDELTVAPDAETQARARSLATAQRQRREQQRGESRDLATTADGVRIEVFANLGSLTDAVEAVAEGAEGCGLLRTEFLFLDREAPPGEDEQRQAYQQIADALGDRPLVVRTLDIGADKPASWLPLAREDNPALGLRGIRVQLARRDLLETQLRALLGVRSDGPLRIMLPMISGIGELRETQGVLDRLASDMGVAAPDLGIMVETPAAALLAGPLAEHAAFFSVGSNDLSQYALACDRTNPTVAAALDGLNPAVLRLIDETVRGGRTHGRTTAICGGLAAMHDAVPILLGLGVTELSVPAAAIAEIKALVRGLDLASCRDLAMRAVAAPDADSVRIMVRAFLGQS